MSLPWFPFYADAYTGDTGHLTCEEHGAYLQLMIAYYRSEKPLPGTDRALSSLVKLPLDRWLECRATLAPFFRVEGGLWHHDRIEAEIVERREKHVKAVDKATNAANARHRKDTTEHAPSKPRASSKAAKTMLETCTSTSTTTFSPSEREEALPPSKNASQGLGSPITKDWLPLEGARDAALAAGFADEEFGAEIRKFVNTRLSDGSFSNNWDASFDTWMLRAVDYRAKQAKLAAKDAEKAPPRVEVDVTPDWEMACKSWVKLRSWPRGIGNDPESPSCRAPMDIRAKHGISPTGVVTAVKAMT